MEFNYLKEKQRMLNSIGRTGEACRGAQCKSCLLSMDRNGRHMNCVRFEIEYPEEATEIVRNWAEKHPKKTRKDVLLEKFPNVRFYDNTPYVCAGKLGFIAGWYDSRDCVKRKCSDCWNEEVTE